MTPRVGHWVRLIRAAPEQGYSGDHLRETWDRRREDPSLVVHVTDTDVYCVEPLTKPERNAHEFWSAPVEDVELVADPHDVDTSSSASRQHYIDTGVYLDTGEAVSVDDDAELAQIRDDLESGRMTIEPVPYEEST